MFYRHAILRHRRATGCGLMTNHLPNALRRFLNLDDIEEMNEKLCNESPANEEPWYYQGPIDYSWI